MRCSRCNTKLNKLWSNCVCYSLVMVCSCVHARVYVNTVTGDQTLHRKLFHAAVTVK